MSDNTLDIKSDRKDSITVIRIRGEFDHDAENDFNSYTEQLDENQLDRVLINMKGIRWMNSRSIRSLLKFYTRVARTGGLLVLTDIQPSVTRILYLTRISSIFSTETTEERGMDRLRKTIKSGFKAAA